MSSPMGFTSRPARWIGFGLVAFLAGRATVDRSPTSEATTSRSALAATIDVVDEHSLRIRFATARPEAIDAERLVIPGAPRFVARASDERTLDVEFAEPLPRAQRFVISSPGVGSASGIELARFETEGPKLTDAHVQKPVGDARRLHLRFDLPIDLAQLQRSLSLRDARGNSVAIDVTHCDNCERNEKVRPGTSFVVQVPKLEFPSEPTRLEIAADLSSKEGPVPIRENLARPIVFDAPLHFERFVAQQDSIVLYFDRELDAIDPQHVHVEPLTEFACERFGSSALRLVGDFPCGSRLRVRIDAGFPGEATSRLEEALSFAIEIPDREPALRFVGDGIALSNQALPEIEIETVNVDAVRVSVREVFADSALHFLRQRGTEWRLDPDRAFSGSEKSLTREIVAGRNETLRSRIDLRELLGTQPRGIFLVGIENPDEPWSDELTLLEITDLGITLRVNDGAAIARVASLASGGAITGVEVELRSLSNRLLARGTTDSQGLCALAFVQTNPDDPPFCAIASTPNDRAFVDVKHFGLALDDRVVEGRPQLKRGGREVFVALDRPWVRPGDSTNGVLLLRDREAKASTGALDLTAFDAGHSVRQRIRLNTSAQGMVSFHLDTAASDRSGIWRIEVVDPTSGDVLGRHSFVVADSEPESVDVEAKFVSPLEFGSDGQLAVSGRFLSGGPLTSAPLSVYVDWRRAPFPSFDGYSFAARDESPIGASEPIRSALDASGKATIAVAPPPLDGSQRLIADMTVEVEERSGRTVTRQWSEPLEVRDFKIGARFRNTLAEVIALGPDGSSYVQSLTGEIDLAQATWSYDEESGESSLERTVVVTRKFTFEQGRARVDFAAELAASDGGWYEIEVRAGGRNVLASRGEPAPPPTTLRVSLPNQSFEPGATVPVVVHAPFMGDALVTLEGAGIHGARVVRLAEGSNRFDYTLPNTEPGVPSSAHLVIQMAKPQREVALQEIDSATAAIGAARLTIARRDAVADVKLELPERVAPGSEFDIAIEAPGAQEVALFAIDEGELGRVGERYSDPLPFFHGPRALESLGANSAVALRSGARFESSPGGDAGDEEPLLAALGEGMAARERAWTYLQTTQLDSSGHGRTRLSLEDRAGREGSLRIVALASGARAIGYATRSLRVAGPLSLQVAGPNLLRTGDLAEFVVTLRNLSGAAQEVELKLSGEFVALDATPNRYALIDGGEQRVIVSLRPDGDAEIGRLVARTSVSGHAEFDREFAMSFAIVPEQPKVKVIEAKRIDGRGEIGVDAEWSSPVAIDVEIDTRPRARLEAAGRALMAYPYGCVEQVSSQLLARLAIGPDRMEDDGVGASLAELQTYARIGYEKLSAMQAEDGSFGFWRGSEPLVLPTLQAFAALLELKDRDLVADTSVLSQLARHVRNELARSPDPVVATLAIRLLSRAGVPVDVAAERVERSVAEGRSAAAKALLAIVLANRGDREKARTLLAGLIGSESGGGSSLDTPLRGRAALLEALLVIDPADSRIHPLANDLLASVDRPELHTTSDLAPALLALDAYFRAFSASSPATTVRFENDGTTLDLSKGRVRHRLVLAPGESVPIVADGPIHCVLTEMGRRAAAPTDSTFTIARSIHDVTEDLPMLPGQPLERGREYEVVLTIDAKTDVENLAIVDSIPSGCDGVRRDLREVMDCDSQDDVVRSAFSATRRAADSLDLRPGSAFLFVDRLAAGKSELRYRVRATFRGEFVTPPTRAEAMYRPGSSVIAAGGNDRVVVR